MRNILVLYSGGADSTLLLLWALKLSVDRITALMFDYGQKHVEELDYARKLLGMIATKAPHSEGHAPTHERRINIADAFNLTASSLLGHEGVGYPGVHSAHVPARNAVFLSIALSVAESNGDTEIWLGANYTDRINHFPDCYQEWIFQMDKLAQITGSVPIKIRAPLLGLEKEDIDKMLQLEGIEMKNVYSGYEPPVQEEEG